MDKPPLPAQSARPRRRQGSIRLEHQRRTLTGPGVTDAELALDHLLATGSSLPDALRAVADQVAMNLAMAVICPDRDHAGELALADLAVALNDEALMASAREAP